MRSSSGAVAFHLQLLLHCGDIHSSSPLHPYSPYNYQCLPAPLAPLYESSRSSLLALAVGVGLIPASCRCCRRRRRLPHLYLFHSITACTGPSAALFSSHCTDWSLYPQHSSSFEPQQHGRCRLLGLPPPAAATTTMTASARGMLFSSSFPPIARPRLHITPESSHPSILYHSYLSYPPD